MKCSVCKKENVIFSRYNAINRGGRSALVCDDCKTRHNKIYISDTKDSAPALKDIKNRFVITAKVENLTAVTAIMRKKNGDAAKVGNSPAKIALPEKTRLNSAIRFSNETLPAFEREYGVQMTSASITFVNGETERTYSDKACDINDLAQWIREREYDFCVLIGCPQWSALNTGTRKAK